MKQKIIIMKHLTTIVLIVLSFSVFGQDGGIDQIKVKTSYLQVDSISYVGKVSINTTSNPGNYELIVNGEIRAKEVIVETGWADYVFENGYNLKSIQEVESFIKENKHLPDIPSANEVEANGVDLGEMNMLLLKKVEELTLYIINQQKEIEALKKLVTETPTEEE